MKNNFKKILFFILIVKGLTDLKAQMSGIYNVPSNFPTIAAAISSLNAVGVSSQVTININAGHTETATTSNGYSLGVISGVSASNQVIFQKTGVGANPLIVGSTGTATPQSNIQDGILCMVGSDYITIDGIDLYDPNLSNPGTMEYGYAFFKANASDGCQYNTIKNCVITLNRVNNFAGTWGGVDGCRGIELSNTLPNSYLTAVTVSGLSGTNSFNKFYSNTIQNVNIGIAITGYASITSTVNADVSNDIGGNSVGTGNTIINYGGGGLSTTTGIYTDFQTILNIGYNLLNNNNGAGVNPGGSLRGIHTHNSGGNTNTVNNNTVTLKGGGAGSSHVAIETYGGTSFSQNAIVNVTNNQVVNCTYTTTPSSGFNAFSYSGTNSTMNVTSNLVNNLTFTGTGTVSLIQARNVVSNTITNVSHNGSSGTIWPIRLALFVDNNLVDGIGFTSTTAIGNISGYYTNSSSTNTITNNIFRNFYTPTTGIISGIYEDGSVGNKVITNNQIYNFTTTAGGAGGATFNGIVGIVGIFNIVGNNIYSLTSTGTTGGSAGSITGIISYAGQNNYISKNRVYDLSSNSSGATVTGLSIQAGTLNVISNNLIGNLTATASSGNNQIVGIEVLKNSINQVFYNTVYINSANSSALFGSSAITASTTSLLDMRNNILVNTSVANGTGIVAAYKRLSNSLTTYSSSSNNNLFYAGVPSANHVIYYDGINSFPSLANYKWYALYRDYFSVTENPTFISTAGANPNFLNINPTIPTQIENGALPTPSISDDHIGASRSNTNPDIGAWEGNYTYADLLPPSYLGSNFISSFCNTTSQTYTAALIDVTGIAGGLFSPRLYYNVNAGPYSSVQGTLTSGTFTNGIWSFNLTYTSLPTDVIQYYIVAQDQSPGANLMAIPPTGFSGTDVNTIITPPSAPLSFSVMYTLNGTYSVGATQTFTSLTQASYAYNNSCLTGPVTFMLTDFVYNNSVETFPITFKFNPDASPTNSLLVRPKDTVYTSITSVSVSTVIKFLNARYITLDGVNSPSTGITINDNSGSGGTAAGIWFASSAANGNNNITVKRTSIYAGTNGACIIASSDGSAPVLTGGNFNDDITIDHNNLLRGYYGLFVSGTPTNAVYTGGLNNWVIKNNIIGTPFPNPVSISRAGLYALNAINFSFTDNIIQNISALPIAGIVTGSLTNATISKNIITGISNTVAVLSSSGIQILQGVNNSVFSKNIITGIKSSSNNGSAKGMYINTGLLSSSLSISNNMISDIYSYNGNSTSTWPIGIEIYGNIGGIDFDNNSVNLAGSFPGAAATTTSAAFFVGSTVINAPNIKFRNNIFANSFNNSNAPSQSNYAFYFLGGTSILFFTNYNNFIANGPGAHLGFYGSNLNTLAAFQLAFGGDLNSVSIAPIFNSNTDLHLQPVAANLSIDNIGAAVAGITVDIDNQVRSVTTPDMGADEFTVPLCTGANSGTASALQATLCAGKAATLVSTGASFGVNATYQWQVSNTAGGPYSNVIGGAGATTTAFISAPLITGTYYYILYGTCGASVAISNEVTVNVNPVPTASASALSSSICTGQNVNLNGASDIGSIFSWYGPNTYTTNLQNPVLNTPSINSSGVYTLITSINNCSSLSSTVSINVVGAPSSLTVSPVSASICSTGSQTIVASGGLIPTVFNFTPQASQNTASIYPAPYSVYYGGQKMQILVLASELASGGILAGPLTSIRFPVVSKNGNWGNSLFNNQNFQVSIGATTLTSLTSNFQSGLTVVSPAINFTPVIGYNNIHYFNTPFIWDGSSNLIIETVFSNSLTGTTLDAVIQYKSPTPFQSTIVYAANNLPFNTIATATSANMVTNLIRPDFKLFGTGQGILNWSPPQGLTSTTGLSVTASPTVSTIYSVTINNSGCSASSNVSISVTPIPTLNILSSPNSVCIGNSSTLTASGALTYSWNVASNSPSITISPTLNTVYTVSTQVSPCPVVTATANIIVNPLPTIIISPSSNTLCMGQSYTFTASGANTYQWSNFVNAPSIVVAAFTNTVYNVIGTSLQGCISSGSVSINPNVVPVLTVTPLTASICPSSTINLSASGASSYSWSNGGTSANTIVNPTISSTYSVTGTNNLGCTSQSVISINTFSVTQINVTPIVDTICVGEQASFSATGISSYSWMPGNINSFSISVSPLTTTAYTVSGVDVNSCLVSSTVNLIVDPCTGIISRTMFNDNVYIFPNPFNTKVFVVSDMLKQNIFVYNALGALLQILVTENGKTEIDLSAQNRGVYFIKIGFVTKKIIKE